ncbi:hypothetical protein ACPCSP_20260 [Streptomyces cinereoruber]|uniref:hypothetical protein n=1 Tax=Streptomyces cinereoruber TaxID=67260 RepID=UPI003C2D4B21
MTVLSALTAALAATALLIHVARGLAARAAGPAAGFRPGPLWVWCPAEERPTPHSVDTGARRCRSCKTTSSTTPTTEETRDAA